ncbi:MAG: TIGR01212 family radical SAM protein [Fibrobacterota bacterium]
MTGHDLPYITYRSWLKKRFGAPVHKIPLNGGFSCPNRDGVKGKDGCAFCDNSSFSPVALTGTQVLDQLRAAISRSSHSLYLPYLQPFSNTYGDVSYLKQIYEPLIHESGVIGLAIGTRPDCLPQEVVTYLGELSRRTYLSIELGLQSASDEVLSTIRRAHSYDDFLHAVRALDAVGIETVAHVMFGLPGQTSEMILDMADKLAALPVAGVKIHQLMIIEGTQVADWYRTGAIAPLTLEEYAERVAAFLRHLRPDQLIHRIMADSRPEHGLIAPLWSARKSESIRYIQDFIKKSARI